MQIGALILRGLKSETHDGQTDGQAVSTGVREVFVNHFVPLLTHRQLYSLETTDFFTLSEQRPNNTILLTITNMNVNKHCYPISVFRVIISVYYELVILHV